MADHDGMKNGATAPTMSAANYKLWLHKAGFAGAIAAGASFALFHSPPVEIAGVSVPIWAAVGLAVGTASIGSSAAHEWVFPMIPHDMKYDALKSSGLAIGTSGLASYGVGSMLGAASPLLFAVGAGSYVAGD